MITIRHLSFFLLTLFIIVSCNKEDTGEYIPEEENIPICFEINFGAETRVATDANLTSTWQDGDKIGIYIVKGNVGLRATGNYVDNLEVTYNKSSNQWNHTPLSGNQKYFPNDGDNLNFYAYYPYQPDIDPTDVLFVVATDQSSEADYNKSDLLLAKAENYRRTQTAVPLNFRHAHSLLQIEVARQGGIPQLDENLQISITDILPDVWVNLETSALQTAGNRMSVSMQKVTASSHTYRALVPAQVLSGSSKIHFSQSTPGSEISMEYAGIQNVSLEAGKVHKYKITLSDY